MVREKLQTNTVRNESLYQLRNIGYHRRTDRFVKLRTGKNRECRFGSNREE